MSIARRPLLRIIFLTMIMQPITAVSNVTIFTFTDSRCNTKSTTSASISVPLDACIITVGMGSYILPTTPCQGGGASSVQRWGFEGTSCSDTWLGDINYGGNCDGTFEDGEVYGSILLTCRKNTGSHPDPIGVETTIQVGTAVSGAQTTNEPDSTDTSGTSSSSTTKPTTTSGNNNGNRSSKEKAEDTCSGGWNCLTYGERIGIIVALSVGIPPIILGLWALQRKSRK